MSRSSSPRRSGRASTISTRRASRARSSPSRGSSRRARRRRRSPSWPRPTPGTPTTTSAAAATTSTPTGLPPRPAVNARQELERYQAAVYNVWRPDDSAYAPLSFERPEPVNIVPRARRSDRPDRGPPAPATSRRPSGASSAGWNARASPTTSTRSTSCTPARWISTPTRSWRSPAPGILVPRRCTAASRSGSTSAAGG